MVLIMDPIIGATIAGSSGMSSASSGILGSVISGAGSLLGGLFGGGSSEKSIMKKQMEYTRELMRTQRNWALDDQMYSAGRRLKNVVGMAKQMGIHPLSALGVQGSYSNITPHSLPPGMGDQQDVNFSGAIESLVRELNGEAKYERRKRELDIERDELEIAQMKTIQKRTKDAVRQEPGSDNKKAISDEAQPGFQTITQHTLRPDNLPAVHPGHLDAEAAEQRRGQIGGEIAGARNSYHDGRWNRAMDRLVARYGAARARNLVDQHWGDWEKIIELSKNRTPRNTMTRRQSGG